MKNDDRIYFNGCSFTYGIGVHDSGLRRFSKVLTQYFNVRELNVGKPGSCNMRIFRRTLIDFTTIKPEYAVIVWSDPLRTEFDFFNQSSEGRDLKEFEWDLMQIRPSSTTLLSKPEYKACELYYSSLESDTRALLHTLTYMVSIQELARQHGIKLIQITFRSRVYNQIQNILDKAWNYPYRESMKQLLAALDNENVYGIGSKLNFNFEDIGGRDNIITGPSAAGHPNEISHLKFATWLADTIKSKGW